MLRIIIALAFACGLSAVAVAEDRVATAEDRNDAELTASVDKAAVEADTLDAEDDGIVPDRRGDDVSGVGYLNHLGIGFAVGLYQNRIGPEFVFPNGKPGASILKPFYPIPGGDDGVIGDGGLNPGGGGINPGEGPCFNCTVNPSPDD